MPSGSHYSSSRSSYSNRPTPLTSDALSTHTKAMSRTGSTAGSSRPQRSHAPPPVSYNPVPQSSGRPSSRAGAGSTVSRRSSSTVKPSDSLSQVCKGSEFSSSSRRSSSRSNAQVAPYPSSSSRAGSTASRNTAWPPPPPPPQPNYAPSHVSRSSRRSGSTVRPDQQLVPYASSSVSRSSARPDREVVPYASSSSSRSRVPSTVSQSFRRGSDFTPSRSDYERERGSVVSGSHRSSRDRGPVTETLEIHIRATRTRRGSDRGELPPMPMMPIIPLPPGGFVMSEYEL
jgi:hypothetical protein